MNLSPRDNFYRCMTLIVDNGNEAAWDLLDYYLSNQGTTLKDFIENNQHEIYHLCYNYGVCCRCKYGTVNKPKSRILYQSQLDILLDTKGSNMPCTVHVRSKSTCSHTINDHYANPNTATKQLDLTLCRCLLINFTNILPQASVERNAFEDLINMRNKCCHAAKGEISSKDYLTYKAQIEKCLLALAQVYGKTHDMQLKIKDAEKRPLDESICKQLQQTILQEQVLQGTTIEIQKMGKSTKRTLRAVNSSMKTAGHTASKIKKIEESTKRTLMVVKSSKRSVERKLKANTDRTMHAIDSSREAEGRTATKIQKIDERLSKCETSKRNRLLGLTKTEIDGHLQEGTFVETPAVQACIKLLETNSLLVLTGAAGTGKSRNSLEILLQFQVKNPEFKTIKLTELHDFTDVVTEEEKLVILFEDIFGRTNTRFAENTDVQIIDRIHACTIKGNIKVILTVRDTIRMSCQWILNSHKIFHGKCEVDLSSETFKMKKTEKESLLLKYFAAHNFQLLEYNDPENYFKEVILDPLITATVNRVTFHNIVESEPLLGFPEACSLFTGNRKLTRLGLSFFKHPSKYLFEEIEKLRKNGKYNEQDRMSYVTLVYILLKEDVLDPDDIELNICIDILESCYGISNKKLPVCHITDAASEMIGRYLIFQCDDCTYHLQHQTIFESILISYNRVDPGLILSRLSFDFIREMVRLQKYKPREGEIVMKITKKYYSMLANRIMEIIQSDYFNKSLPLNFQLLCESEIIRQNDECFMKSLIEKAHDAFFQPEYDLQTFVTYRGVCKLCKLYLPAFLLKHITQQNKMNDSITLLVDHITLVLNSKSGEDIEFVCKSSLLDAFLNVCDLENNENILDNMWVSVRSLDMSEMTEYIRSSINRVCSRCPMTTMRWMLNNIDQRIFDMNQLMKRACEFKRLDIVQFLCETINHNQLDFTAAFVAAINNVWNDTDESVSKWLINNIDLQLFDMKQITSEVLEVGCEKDLHFLLQHVDNCMLDLKAVFNKLYKKGRRSIESLLKWIGTNVEKEKINTLEMSNQACLTEDSEVVKYLINNIDLGPLDVMSVLMSSMNSNWQSDNKDLIQWICSNVDLKQINIINIIDTACEEKRYENLKILLKNIKENLNSVLRSACEKNKLELTKILLSVADHDKLNMREAVRSVCFVDKIDLLECFLHNVDHSLYDVHHVLKESCRYGWIHIVKWLLDNIEHTSLDINTAMHTVLHRDFVGPDNTLVRLLLQYPINDTVDVDEIIQECCWWGLVDLVQLICDKNDPNQLDMKEAMNTACSRNHFDLVEWMLANIENNLFDLPTAFDKAIHADCDDLNASLITILINRIDNELINMASLLKIKDKDCLYDIVECVLGSVDHNKFDFQEAFNTVYDTIYGDDDSDINSKKEKYLPLIKLILEKVNPESLELTDALNQACRDCSSDVVTLLLENNDHKKLDVQKAMNIVYNLWVNNKDDNDERAKGQEKEKQYENDEKEDQEMEVQEGEKEENEGGDKEDEDKDGENINEKNNKYTHLVKLILKQVNHDSLDLKKVFNQACQYGCLDVVTLVLENKNHTKLDTMEAVKITYSSVRDKFYDIIDRGEKYELLIKIILKKVNHDSLDFKEIMNKACRYGCLDIVTFVLQNIDLKKSDIMEAVSIVCDSPYRNNVNRDSIVLKIMYKASCSGYLEVVTFVLENTDHTKIDIMEAVNIIYSSIIDDSDNMMDQIEKYEPLIRQILEKVNHDLLDLKTVFKHAFCKRCLEVVRNLLENTDHGKLNVKGAMNIVMTTSFDPRRSLISKIGKMKEPVIKLILEKVNHDSLALKDIMNYACCNGLLDVVTCLLENTDHKKLDIMEAVNVVFCSTCDVRYYNNVMNNLRDTYDPLIRHILEKVNHDLLDLKTIFHLACRIGGLKVVAYLLENINHDQLDAKEAVNGVYRPVCNDDYCYDFIDNLRDTHEPLIRHILEKVNHDLLDLKTIFHLACRIGCLELVTYLLENINHDQLDAMEAVNDVYRSVYNDDDYYKFIDNIRDTYDPLIRHILEKVNHDLLDLKTIFVLACRIGCLKVVAYLLENINHDQLDAMEAVNDLYLSVCDDDDYYDFIDNLRKTYEPLIRHILEKVNHDLLDLKTIFHLACRIGCLEVVAYLLENINHDQLDAQEAVNDLNRSVCDTWYYKYGMNNLRDTHDPLIRHILEKVNHDLLDLKTIFVLACRIGCLKVVTYLLENINHGQLDAMEAVNDLYRSVCNDHDYDDNINNLRETYDPLIRHILENVNHDLLDLKTIFHVACRIGCLEVVTYLFENNNHYQVDVKEAVNDVFRSVCNVDYDNDVMNNLREKCELLIRHILEKVNHDLLDLKTIFVLACSIGCLELVAYLIENINHDQLDVKEAVNGVYRSVCNDHDYDDNINNLRETYDPLIRHILENVNHDLLDLKTIFHVACRIGCLEVVTYFLEKKDHKTLDLMGAVKKLCYPSINEDTDDEFWYVYSNEAVTKLLLPRVKVDILDVEVLLNVACRKEWLDIVRWLVENVDHSMFDIDTSMNVLMLHSTENNLAIFKLLLENISQTLFNIRSVIEQALRINHTEKVLLLLQTQNNTLFDIKYVMNEACRNSNLLVIKYVMENVDKKYFDVRSAMNKACRSAKPNSLEVVKLLLENIPHNMLNLESAMNNACRYDNVDVVRWFWDNLDRKLFNEKSSWNNAFYNCNEKMISYLLNNMDENMLDKSKALSKACQNIREGDTIMALLFKQPNMKTPENCKQVMTEACVHCNRNVVKWLMSHTDIQPLVYKTSLIDTIKATINMTNNRGKSDRISIVQFMLEHDSIKKLGQNDMSEVMEAVSSIGHLDMVQRLWHNTEQSMFNMRAIVNTACESGQFEIVDWFLQIIELKSIDVQSVMVESCAYGWLKIVKFLLSKFDQENFDLWTSIDEACSYGRYEIVKFLLENVDSKLFDTDLVLEKACGYGWKEIILWLFDNIDNSFIDLKACMFEACAQGRLEIVELLISKYGTNNFESDVDILISISCKNSGNRGVIKFLIENFDLTQSHIDIIIRSACTYGLTEIVTLILDSCKHNKNLMDEAMKNACNSGETEIVEIFLEKVDASFIEIKHAMIISCQKGWNELVSVLLERVDHSLFDLTVAMNEACRCGEADIVELLIEKVDHKFFNFEKAIMEAYQSHLNENLVLILLKYINNSTRNIEGMSKKAHEYGWRKVSSRLKRMSYNEN